MINEKLMKIHINIDTKKKNLSDNSPSLHRTSRDFPARRRNPGGVSRSRSEAAVRGQGSSRTRSVLEAKWAGAG